MLAPEHVVKHDGQSTRKVMMKDAKSSVVNKTLDEESVKLRDLAREHIPKHETQVSRKKRTQWNHCEGRR